MTVDELRATCRENIAQGGDVVLLTLPPPMPSGYTMRLCRTYGPRGEIICTNQQTGYSVVRFKAAAVLKFLDKQQTQPSTGANP